MRRTWLAIKPAFAALLTIGAAALPLRLIEKLIINASVATSSFPAGLARIVATAGMRFIEIIAVIAALAILFRLTRSGSFAGLGLSRRGLAWLPIGFITPILALLLAALVAYASGLLPVNRVLYPGPWPTLFALAAATHAGWIEEIAFRGVLMQGIERASNRTVAILLSACLFTALHFFAPFKLTWAWWILVAAAGLGLAWAFYATGRSLWLPIGLHWGFDLGVFLLLGLPGETRGWLHWPLKSGQIPPLSVQAGTVILIGAALTAAGVQLLLRKGQARP